jgi:hypothetical protein
MFNKRFIYFADGIEAGKEQPKSPEEQARERLAGLMPSDGATELQDGDKGKSKAKEGKMDTEHTGNSMEDEAKQTNDKTRADIIAVLKEGQKMNPNVPPAGVDRAVFNDMVKDLKAKLPQGQGDHFSTHWESLTSGDDAFYFMSVFDKGSNPNVRFFFKKGEDFSIKDKTFLESVDDATYKNLTGKEREKKA